MTNKKVRNATSIGKYHSKLEQTCARLLEEAGLNFRFETEKFNLIEPFTPALHFYKSTPQGLKKQVKKNGTCMAMKAISYTPDFWYGDDKILIFIETKGYRNEIYPYKRKLFFRHMSAYKLCGREEDRNIEIYFFEPSKAKEIRECIEIIKEILKNGHK